jgi:hypothetical protein
MQAAAFVVEQSVVVAVGAQDEHLRPEEGAFGCGTYAVIAGWAVGPDSCHG